MVHKNIIEYDYYFVVAPQQFIKAQDYNLKNEMHCKKVLYLMFKIIVSFLQIITDNEKKI